MPDGLSGLYRRYVDRYTRFARMRGFRTELNDWPYVRRSFIECWAEPGFHRFWRTWNPGIAYFVWRVYTGLGGRKRWAASTIGAFLASGVAHNLIVMPFVGCWSWMLPTTFLCLGLLVVLSRACEAMLSQERWPWPVNVAVNVGLVALAFEAGFRVDRIL